MSEVGAPTNFRVNEGAGKRAGNGAKKGPAGNFPLCHAERNFACGEAYEKIWPADEFSLSRAGRGFPCGEWCGERKRAYEWFTHKPLISLVRNARIELAAFSSGE